MNAPYSCAEDLLKKAGIYTFASEMSSIANQCFTSNERDDFSDLVLKYIDSGGVYGTTENNIAVHKSKAESSALYVLRRLFPPYKAMVMVYPVLRKLPFLLPLYWIIRGGSVVFKGKTKRITSELSSLNHVTDDTVDELTQIRSRLGI